MIIVLIFNKHLKTLPRNIAQRSRKGDNIKIGRDGIEIGERMSKQELFNKVEQKMSEWSGSLEGLTFTQRKRLSDDVTLYRAKYREVEKSVYEIFLRYISPDFTILTNRRIEDYYFDLIIETDTFKKNDYIIEIKFYPLNVKDVDPNSISERLNSLVEIYKRATKRIAKPILIIVWSNETEDYMENNRWSKKQSILDSFSKNIKVLSLVDDQISETSKSVITSLLQD